MQIDKERFHEYSRYPDEYFSGQHIFGNLGRFFAWILIRTPVTPNQLTWFWGALMIVSPICYATGDHMLSIVGGALWIVAYALDYTDGVIAKYKDQRSARGAYLDMIIHRITYPMLMFCIGFGVYSAGGMDILDFEWFKDEYYLIFGVMAGISMSVFMDITPLYERFKSGERSFEDGKGSIGVEGALFDNKGLFRKLMNLNPLVFTNMMLLLLVFALFDLMGVFIILFGLGYALATVARIMIVYLDL